DQAGSPWGHVGVIFPSSWKVDECRRFPDLMSMRLATRAIPGAVVGGTRAEQTAKARASIWMKDEAHDLRSDRRHWPATPGAGRRPRCRPNPRHAVPAGAYGHRRPDRP